MPPDTDPDEGTIATVRPDLVLRPLTVDHLADYVDLVDRNRAHFGRRGDYQFEQTATRDAIAAHLAEPTGPGHRLGVWLAGELVGRVDLVPVDPPRYAIGYWLSEHVTGRGLMTDAVAATLDLARRIGVTEIYAGVTHGNAASIAVLRRLSFEHIEDAERHGRWRLPLIADAPPPVMAADLAKRPPGGGG